MVKQVKGSQVFLDGEAFYKIENYDFMTDFFMTVTSSSDVWNFCWAQGGISAGRKNCDFAIFPYYTSDKLQDTKNTTGPVTIIKIKNEGKNGIIWQPFENLFSTGRSRYTDNLNIQRNIYKNQNGSKIWFEEINLSAGISFRYGWTSSAKYGLIKMNHIENLTDRKLKVEILDGCRNIMSSSSDAAIQNGKSNLLDAYKKSEVLAGSNMAIFSLSSVVTDKAEPSESLFANVSWFSTPDRIILDENAVPFFLENKQELLYSGTNELNGKRGQCFIIHNCELLGRCAENWEQVLDVNYDVTDIIKLESEIEDRERAVAALLKDIQDTEDALTDKIAQADGIQTTKNEIGDLHHRTNVMFNIMRGGIFANNGKINPADFVIFAKNRNTAVGAKIQAVIRNSGLEDKDFVQYDGLKKVIEAEKDSQMERLFMEYLPLTFSRRHGDPSRPWNRFNIEIKDENGKEKINYEGNWRDIFQNWEALLWSYPEYAENVAAVFLNSMTIEGYNPYRISRDGLDWEVPEKGNPWAQYGYWGDHQVIYLQKLLEFIYNLNKKGLFALLNKEIFGTANIPYRIKSYAEVYKHPRNSITFDYELDKTLKNLEKNYGSDARLILDENNCVQLTTMATKLVQLVLAKMLNHIPEAGIWMNTQRPEWNDANNALAGFGTSVVTMGYLHRMLKFLSALVKEFGRNLKLEETTFKAFTKTVELYKSFAEEKKISDKNRKIFTDQAGKIFEDERNEFYAKGYSGKFEELPAEQLYEALELFAGSIEHSIKANRRQDGLFHSYNSVRLMENGISIVNLKPMLEGQVSVLSCSILSKNEMKELLDKLRKSEMFETNQHSYMLYPNTRLKGFKEKNNIAAVETAGLEKLLEKTGNSILRKDLNGTYHFNPLFRNADVMREYFDSMDSEKRPSADEISKLEVLYEKQFNHQSFTGRSGSFYGYEGLGCIYWHMVSKLLLAVQENISEDKDELIAFYKDIKKGLGAAKKPSDYGAFPFDPYSHTPFMQGAKQPGMTGQVKEEVLARWGELGVKIQEGKAVFEPVFLDKTEFDSGKLYFTWCGTPVTYDNKKSRAVHVEMADGTTLNFKGNSIPEMESSMLFSRNGIIKSIVVGLKR